MVRDRGFEPLTPSVSRKCSTTELTAHSSRGYYAPTKQVWRMNFCALTAAAAPGRLSADDGENSARVAIGFRQERIGGAGPGFGGGGDRIDFHGRHGEGP